MERNINITIEQKFLELLKMDYEEWIFNKNNEIILKKGEIIEKVNDIHLYNKIINDIEIVFFPQIKDNMLVNANDFFYGKLIKFIYINNDTIKYIIKFIQKNYFTNQKSNLAKLRRDANMSQTQLAMKAGISVATIRNYEQNPSTLNTAQYQTLKILSQILGVDIKDIITFGEEIYSLEQLYPDEEMNNAIKIIENYINMENKNICIYVTGRIGSGVSTITKSLASYIAGSRIVGDRLIVQDLYEENREMLCIRLKIIQNNKRIIDSITKINPYKNEILWQFK